MSLSCVIVMLKSDLYRYAGEVNVKAFVCNFIACEGLRYSVHMRLCEYFRCAKPRALFILPYLICWFRLRHYQHKYGIYIPSSTVIGSGFYIGHPGGIVVNDRSVIGKNCNISQGVTLGQANRGRNKGTPTIGDNVYIGPGAKIVGAIKIGSNVAIGANCVVTTNIPDNAVVVGVPGRVISFQGSDSYVNRIDYEGKL